MEILLTIYSDEKEYFKREVSLPCVIGRGKQCDVAIVHPLISRRHCEIYEENGVVMARDLGSLNGTFFGGVRIGRGIPIPYGSSFSIGRLMLRVDRIGVEAEPERRIVDAPREVDRERDVPQNADASEDAAELVDVESLISDKPRTGVNVGGDSSVIDLGAYLKNG